MTNRVMAFDFEGLIQLLAGHLYSEKKVFIRELIQNAHDAIVRRGSEDPDFDLSHGFIDVLTDLTSTPAKIVFRDNGIGMTEDELHAYLSTIGRSGTKIARETEGLEDLIGQFGIGFLSGFVVGSKVEVRTRHWKDTSGCLWENQGRAEYSVTPVSLETAGTEVTIFLASAEDRGLLHDDSLKAVVREYADMIRIPIRLNDPDHHLQSVNRQIMPWERDFEDNDESRVAALVYLQTTVPDNVLEVIPVRLPRLNGDGLSAAEAEGLLYITRTRVIATDVPRVVRVFLKRLFVCDSAKDLLPPWATFVNGILNTTTLSPNAARDNFSKDDAFARLRDRLGQQIIAHFERLKQEDPQRLSEILAYHDLAVKSACYHYDVFFDKFHHLLEWRINAKAPAARDTGRPAGRRILTEDAGANYSWATLPDILDSLPEREDGRKLLGCFTSSSSANQYFEMADAAGSTVVDASFPYEAELLKTWASKLARQVVITYVDREDDPNVFRPIDPQHDRFVSSMARTMSGFIRPGGSGRLSVEARRFEPVSLPAVLKTGDAGAGTVKARGILSDPNAPADLRLMAEEMLRLGRNSDMRMAINAGNPLVQKLASLVARTADDADLQDLMLGVYNDAILYNQELMTPRNAQLFHEQFQRLIEMAVKFIDEREGVRRDRDELDAARAALRPQRGGPARQHVAGFFITPFSDAFGESREAVRMVVEDRFGCELRTASEWTFDELIRGNVRAHMNDAEFFVADVTGSNPNVMLEVGAAFGGDVPRPLLLITAVSSRGARPELSADLQGHIAVSYVAGHKREEIARDLESGFLKNAKFSTLLNSSEREKYVSSEMLRKWTRTILNDPTAYERLAKALPTEKVWRMATEAAIRGWLGEEADAAQLFIGRVKENLPH